MQGGRVQQLLPRARGVVHTEQEHLLVFLCLCRPKVGVPDFIWLGETSPSLGTQVTELW